MMKRNAVSVTNLTFRYGQLENLPLFSQTSFTLKQGEHVLVLAPPDSGKSTLGRLMCALVPKYQEGVLDGSIVVDGRDVRTCEPWELTQSCTLVCQDPQEQLLMTTCEDEIAFPLESLGLPRDIIVKRVRNALHSWHLNHVAHANPQELSGGERKRLLLAVTDAIQAPVWILDEAFDDLDAMWRGQLIQRISESDKTILVLASRYIDEFRGTFDTYGLLHEQKIHFAGEEDIAVRFETICDESFPSVEIDMPKGVAHTLTCTEILAEHPRKSVGDSEPFILQASSFSLSSGELVALVGPNGSGKSTFSRTLCGLHTTIRGFFSYDGGVVDRKTLHRLVGYVFQNPDFELFLPTVRDELDWSARHVSCDKQTKKRMVEECAERFHLNLTDSVATMAYGMRKHLQGAIHYLLDRPFYILDELDSGVTYSAAFEMVALLRSRGAGILLITHDRAFAEAMAERTYTIQKGILSGGTTV